MLTPYDELPVHQYARPFSELPVSDFNWDDGYYFGVYNAEAKVFLYLGMRVTPNADMIGAYAGVSVDGKQTTFRASRTWRSEFATAIGPLRIEFVVPYREIRLVLEPNGSGVAFDLTWIGLSAAHEEAHHYARKRGRLTTDQTRYGQSGTAQGWIEVEGQRFEVRPHEWYADRDHSWGLYEPRAPLSDPREWLPPAEAEDPAQQRRFRFWLPFQTSDYTGFYHFHENGRGERGDLNDVFGTPFEGLIDFGFDSDRPQITFVDGQHDLRFRTNSRVLDGGTISLVDDQGRSWRQDFEVAALPWATLPIGYYQGTWTDGGNIHTYHGPPEPYVEWDVLDLSSQPVAHTTYDGRLIKRLYGAEYLVRVRTEGPLGVSDGLGHLEFFMHRAYERYQPDA